ncbi:MAG: hypothetical protein DWQ37_15140 [Planctomycetota bacterium]|nr:MAG: hypothetical protein DWQ37_15140 [Planctomycetota bacterium]
MDYIGLLEQYDDPQRWDYPEGFDYDAASMRFADFVDALSDALGQALKTESGSCIQDASFHSQIYLPLDKQRFALIVFSNFGDMVTFSEDEPIPVDLKETVMNLLKRHEYVYVPSSVLERPYTGKNPGVTGIRDWWTRYFDWV